MNRRQARALTILRTEISKDLIVKYVIESMVKSEIISNNEKKEILSCGESIGSVNCHQFREQILKLQTETFLDLLVKKVLALNNAFDRFLTVLYKDDNYPWLGKRLEQVFDDETSKDKIDELIESTTDYKSVSKSHDVPNKVRNLLERSEKIEDIRDKLIQLRQNGYGWLVLHGMGGSGKSILAAEAVRDWINEEYSDGIWWTNCGQMTKENKFDDGLLLIKMQILWDKFCQQFEGKYKPQKFECIESAINKLKLFFNPRPKSLIVLDDVWNKEVLQKFEFGIPVLLTTRDKSIIPYNFREVKYIQTVDNDDYGLTVEESRELLSLWVKAPVDKLVNEHVTRIIEKVKGNPMCLTLIGSAMEEKGNELDYWKGYHESLEKSGDCGPISPRRRTLSTSNFVYDSFDFQILVEQSFERLSKDLKHYFCYFSLFLEDIRIPIKVFEILWEMSQFQVTHIVDQLISKSLVLKNKANDFTLYTVHDIILYYLKTQCKDKSESLHAELLDRYFKSCQTDSDQIDYTLLLNDGYIYYFLGHHIYKSNRHELFAQIFLDLSFVVNKIRYTGPSDLLNDYISYKEYFENSMEKYEDYVKFVSTNADLLCDSNIDVLQLSLCQPIDSHVYKDGSKLIENKDKLYFKWCNQSNVRTSKLLSTKLHTGSVKSAVFCPKKSIIVSVGSDRLVRIWDSNTGKQLRTMKGHQNVINCVQINSDGTILITASDDGTVKLWDMELNSFTNDDYLMSPRPRSGSNYPYITDGNLLSDDSRETYEEHLNSGETDTQVEVKCCAFSPNNRLVVSGGSDRSAHIWTVDGLITKFILKDHSHSVKSCQFSFDSKWIITASGEEVNVWSSIAGTHNWNLTKTLKHDMLVENCVFNGKLNYIYASSGRYIYKWSPIGRNLPICHYNNMKTKYYATHCTVSPNSKYVVTGTTTDQIVIWLSDPPYTRASVATFKGPDRITFVTFNSDSTKLLSCCEDGTVVIWDTSKAFGASMVALRKKFAVQNHEQSLKVLTPDDNGTIRLFIGLEGKEDKTIAQRPNPSANAFHFEPTYDITCCALSRNLDILLGTADGELILTYHASTRDETYFLDKHDSEVSFCAFVGLNKFITASKDSKLRIYNKISRQYELPKYDITQNKEIITTEVIMGPIINCKLFSKETKILVWCENGSLFVIDLLKNRLIAQSYLISKSQINCADITENEELIATVSCDKSIILWRSHLICSETERNNNENPNVIYILEVRKTDSCPRSCRFAPNGTFLAIGDDSGKIQILDFYGPKRILHFDGAHSNWVNDIVISPKGNLIISVSKSIKLWDRDGNLLQTFKTNGGLMSNIYAHFIDDTDNGHRNSNEDYVTIVTVDDAGLLYILRVINFIE